jgi:endonuclease-3|tara:strand:- start:746 stop:1381 length:636 start_codon:yes stop_codon:yes gene_type:complete
MNAKKCSEIYKRLAKKTPKPTTELNFSSPFELLIAVILSAQATDIGVNKATAKLFKTAPTPQAMLALGLTKLKAHIQTIGLFNNKAKNIQHTCELLVEKHNSTVPEDRIALESLPGVGRKTANVILNTAFGQPTIAVDTHIFRVSNRTGIAPGKNVATVEQKLLEITPEKFKLNAHHWLLLHGRYTCKARKPECQNCIIFDLCQYKDKIKK